MTSLARLYSSRAVKVSSTSLGSSSTIKIRPSLFVVSISLLVVLEMRNRTSRRDQRRPRPRPCLRDDVLCAEPWPVQCQCLQMHQTGAGVETRQTVYLHTSYQNPLRCPYEYYQFISVSIRASDLDFGLRARARKFNRIGNKVN